MPYVLGSSAKVSRTKAANRSVPISLAAFTPMPYMFALSGGGPFSSVRYLQHTAKLLTCQAAVQACQRNACWS